MPSQFLNLLAIIRKPAYPLIPIFPAGQDMSWIPDLSSTPLVISSADETPNGVIVTFTFSGPPQLIAYNGQLLRSVTDFTVIGNTGTLAVAPPTGSEIFAVVTS